MSEAVELFLKRPIAKTADGKDIFAAWDFFMFLRKLRDRTGPAGNDRVAEATQHIDTEGRVFTADGLPLGALAGTGLARTVAAPLSASSASQIDVAAHDAEYVGKTYDLPAAALTGLSTDTNYFIFYVIADDDYDVHAESDAANIRAKKVSADAYILLGQQRTQDGGGGYSPPPPPPPGGGGGAGGGGGGGGDPN